MRYFWIFFSAYILFLSVSPCCGGEKCGDDWKLTTINSSENGSFSKDHPQGSHHDDICSPFCSCACCGSHVFYVQPFAFMENTVIEPTVYKIPTYTFQFVSKFEANIWQPPQLS